MSYTAIRYFYSVYDARKFQELPNTGNIHLLISTKDSDYSWSRNKFRWEKTAESTIGYFYRDFIGNDPFVLSLNIMHLRIIQVKVTYPSEGVKPDGVEIILDIPLAEYLEKHPEIDLFEPFF